MNGAKQLSLRETVAITKQWMSQATDSSWAQMVEHCKREWAKISKEPCPFDGDINRQEFLKLATGVENNPDILYQVKERFKI